MKNIFEFEMLTAPFHHSSLTWLLTNFQEETAVPMGETGVKFLNPDRYVIGMMVHNQNILLHQ